MPGYSPEWVLEQNPSKQGLKLNPKYKTLKAWQKVLEQNPSKQGLKQETTNPSLLNSMVLEQNPSKQGLKRYLLNQTFLSGLGVLEQNPSKQGLKHEKPELREKIKSRFRAKSIKTRIETTITATSEIGTPEF